MNTIRTAATALPLILGAYGGLARADAVVHVRELAINGPGTMVSDIASDGSVIGWSFGADMSDVIRWRPDGTRENLGGRVTTAGPRVPLISGDGRTIVGTRMHDRDDPDLYPIGQPATWSDRTPWTTISNRTLPSSHALGMSDDGRFLVGSGPEQIDLPQGVGTPRRAWIWSSATGQVVLPNVPGLANATVAAVSNDGRVAAGAAFNIPSDARATYYGTIWTDGTPRQLFDADRRPVGEAMACNSDCSVVVGAGLLFSNAGSKQAWRWTAQTGVQLLGEVPGVLPGLLHFAADTNEDGTLIVGYYNTPSEAGDTLTTRGFVWRAADGIADLVDFLAAHGVDYGAGREDMPVLAMSRDGRYLLVAANTPQFALKPAVIRIDSEAVFTDGLESADVH